MAKTEPADEVAQSLAVALACHPDGSGGPVRGIGARICRMRRGMLSVTYTVQGDVHRVSVPAPRAPRIAQGLWQHTCCELFVRLRGAAAYHEFNFAPSGEWAAYAFEDYREGGPLADESLAPHLTVQPGLSELELEASIDLARLSSAHAAAPLALGLSAVIETNEGALYYWALAHAPGKPDFHHPGAFALELDAVRH
ncbi:MAG: DOMON-like domain-containing protein [Burkholderiales bacterium]